ncbi:cache domain-containing protein [Halomonas sp. BC04]|uniref:cache domain-containing protein n=1 Tax=Halomonas sp. BC04 TaxID=1403540 RepID=UPI0003ED63D2|nr:cache domain-containing protein [Halomonas sp. BC04]EWH00172.1 hypothetical protein Q427_20720 [Halomonas sp. BC04]
MFTFRTKLTLLTLLPLLVLIAGVTFFAIHQSARLSGVQSDILKDGLLEAKQAELKNYMELAYTAIREIYEDTSLPREVAQGLVADAFHRMEYGSDGYFFVYDYDGLNIVHPRLENLVGQDLWSFRDEDGKLLIQRLVERAREGGGFTEYRWDKPSGGESVPKLGYSIGLDDWGWMVGTGLYLDDIELVVSQMEYHMVENARRTILLMAFVTVSCLLVIAVIGLAVNLSEARVANRRLVKMAQKTFSFLEKERRRISRELHDGINQLLVSARFKLERIDDAWGGGTMSMPHPRWRRPTAFWKQVSTISDAWPTICALACSTTWGWSRPWKASVRTWWSASPCGFISSRASTAGSVSLCWPRPCIALPRRACTTLRSMPARPVRSG